MSRTLVLFACMVWLAGCASAPPLTDHDPKADFSRLATFGWLQADPVAATQAADDQVSPLNRQRIADAIEQQLAAGGFRKAAEGTTPDFLVSFAVGIRQRTEVSTAPETRVWFGYWGWPYHVGADVDVRQYDEPRLAIDMYDGTSRKPIWHGESRAPLYLGRPEQARAAIPAVVKTIVVQFPPKVGAASVTPAR